MCTCIYCLCIYTIKKIPIESMLQVKGPLPCDTSKFCNWSCISFLRVFIVSPEVESAFFCKWSCSLLWEEMEPAVTPVFLCVWNYCYSKCKTEMKRDSLKEGSGEVEVELGHMSEKDIVPRDMGVIVLRTQVFILVFKTSEMNILEHRWSL